MSTKIDKKDTLDIADSIAMNIRDALKEAGFSISGHIWFRDIIEEGLNDWISECEIEDANWQRHDEEGNAINV